MGRFICPRRSALDDGVGVDEKLSGASDESRVVGFTAGGETGVELDQGFVPSEGGRERSCEQRSTQASPSTGDVALTFVLTAVVIERSETGKRGGFLTANAPEFRHPDDECEPSALADARNAADEIEAAGEILVDTQYLDDTSHLGGTPRLQARDVGENHASQP